MRSSTKRATKRALGAGVFAGIAYALWRAWRARVPQAPREIEWASAPFPFPPVPRPASVVAPAAIATTSTDPNEDGSCPVDYPVKGKLASGIYHVEGGANYDRTRADRCYADEDAAKSDGLRRSKV
jgi:hypothetical protein